MLSKPPIWPAQSRSAMSEQLSRMRHSLELHSVGVPHQATELRMHQKTERDPVGIYWLPGGLRYRRIAPVSRADESPTARDVEGNSMKTCEPLSAFLYAQSALPHETARFTVHRLTPSNSETTFARSSGASHCYPACSGSYSILSRRPGARSVMCSLNL